MGWIANILLLLGALAVGYKNRLGFILSLLGNALWMVVAYYKNMYDLASVEFIFCGVNIWSWIHWGKNEND